jgi:hypothetical protein
MVTSGASFLPFLGRNVDKQSAELLLYETGRKYRSEDSSLLGCDVVSIGGLFAAVWLQLAVSVVFMVILFHIKRGQSSLFEFTIFQQC